MNRVLYFLFIVSVICCPLSEVIAAKRKALSHIGVYAGAGYANLLHDIPGSRSLGGGNGVIGLQYFLSYNNCFNFHLGVESMLFNSVTAFDDFVFKSKFYYNDPLHNNHVMDYLINFTRYSEQHNHLSINIPLMLGAGFDKFYFAAGAKLKCSAYGYTATRAKVRSSAVDPEFIESLDELPSHNITSWRLKSGNAVKFGIDVTASIELGLVLNEWMPDNVTTYGSDRVKKQILYRLGLFADYGIINQNRFSHTDGLVTFPMANKNPAGNYVVMEKDIVDVHTNSLLTSAVSDGVRFNSLVVGVKFSVLIQTSKTYTSKCNCIWDKYSRIRY